MLCGRSIISCVARMAKLVDARDLKSLGVIILCRFKSGSGHFLASLFIIYDFCTTVFHAQKCARTTFHAQR